MKTCIRCKNLQVVKTINSEKESVDRDRDANNTCYEKMSNINMLKTLKKYPQDKEDGINNRPSSIAFPRCTSSACLE